MKYGVYSIRDLKTGFLPPTVDLNDGSAIRNFEHACRAEESLFFSHPDDYVLFRVGTFDTDSGRIIPLDPISDICPAYQVDQKAKKAKR